MIQTNKLNGSKVNNKDIIHLRASQVIQCNNLKDFTLPKDNRVIPHSRLVATQFNSNRAIQNNSTTAVHLTKDIHHNNSGTNKNLK